MAGMFYLEIKYDHINDRHVFNRVVVTRVRDLSTLNRLQMACEMWNYDFSYKIGFGQRLNTKKSV